MTLDKNVMTCKKCSISFSGMPIVLNLLAATAVDTLQFLWNKSMWLALQALTNNPKVDVVEGDKYRFKPVLNVHNRQGLLRLLDRHDMQGLGGILLEEVEESVPNAAKALKVC